MIRPPLPPARGDERRARRSLPLVLALCVVAGASTGFPGPKTAGGGVANDVGIALHRKNPTTRSGTVCTSYSPNAENLPCSEYWTTAPQRGYSVIYFVVVSDATYGINGATFGIDYHGRPGYPDTGIDPEFSWFTVCADGSVITTGTDLNLDGTVQASEEFPAPKGGIHVTWTTCQKTSIFGVTQAVAGALTCYAFSPDLLRSTADSTGSAGPELTVSYCDGSEDDLLALIRPELVQWSLGWIGFGSSSGPGFTPCPGQPIPVRPATWGRIKGLYRTP
jgi:hypothetical protein